MVTPLTCLFLSSSIVRTTTLFLSVCHLIIPLCLLPHSTHILQPLDVGVFSPLAKAYKTRIQQHSMFGAERITNQQFLEFFQLARKEAISLRNIASAWRATGLRPFNPSLVLQKHKPSTPVTASFTANGDIQLQPTEAQKVNQFMADLLEVCPTSFRSKVAYLGETALTALSEKHAFS